MELRRPSANDEITNSNLLLKTKIEHANASTVDKLLWARYIIKQLLRT